MSVSRTVVLAGNVGVPITAMYDDLCQSHSVVLELSSFMLEDVRRFRANVSTVLNLAEDHVDRYDSFDTYAMTKRSIVRHARPGDVFVRNLDDEYIRAWTLPHLELRTVAQSDRRADAYLDGDLLRVGDASVPASRLLLRGRHHHQNVLFAVCMAAALGSKP